ncbi:MAG: glycosyltransferase family 2 protein [Ignavibacteriae bacterium]|nr:glycosyltransferase family 2 protein [Ignavibacteriota bacterium]
MIDLTIIIVHYHAEEYLRGCLNSIFKMEQRVTYEVIVIDNGSEGEKIQSILQEFPSARYIKNSINIGFVKANNQGLVLANGRYVLFLNPDTEIQNQSISLMVEYLNTNHNVGIVGPQLLYSDGTVQTSYFHFPNTFSIFIEFFLSSRLATYFEKQIAMITNPKKVDVIRGACLMARKELLTLLGGMNEHLFMYSEETDLCYKTKQVGFENVFLPSSVVYHHEQKSMKKQQKEFVTFHYLRSKLIFLFDNYSYSRAKLLSFILKSGLLTRIFIYKLFNKEKAYFLSSVVNILRDDGIW